MTRRVLVGPGAGAPSLLLARADSPEQESRIGNQTGRRVSLFLYTDDFWADYRAMKESGVSFTEEPREEEYGTVVVFEDLYGNLWDLLEPSGQPTLRAAPRSAPGSSPGRGAPERGR